MGDWAGGQDGQGWSTYGGQDWSGGQPGGQGFQQFDYGNYGQAAAGGQEGCVQPEAGEDRLQHQPLRPLIKEGLVKNVKPMWNDKTVGNFLNSDKRKVS